MRLAEEKLELTLAYERSQLLRHHATVPPALKQAAIHVLQYQPQNAAPMYLAVYRKAAQALEALKKKGIL